VAGTGEHPVRRAGPEDVDSIGRLLHEFNLEFHEPTPPAADLADRFTTLLAGGDTLVLLGGEDPDGLAVLRFRPAIWTSGLECHLAELYVRPPMRRLGIGWALMRAALDVAEERGADTMDIGVDEPDHGARRLYERLGFSHRSDGPDGPVMYVYERQLHPPPR
jgi:ribosomal protein S18 acetylase RimI-like enzyme